MVPYGTSFLLLNLFYTKISLLFFVVVVVVVVVVVDDDDVFVVVIADRGGYVRFRSSHGRRIGDAVVGVFVAAGALVGDCYCRCCCCCCCKVDASVGDAGVVIAFAFSWRPCFEDVVMVIVVAALESRYYKCPPVRPLLISSRADGSK